jgi:hypothetical protein
VSRPLVVAGALRGIWAGVKIEPDYGSFEEWVRAQQPHRVNRTAGKCECPEFRSGLPCGRDAKWLVQVGTRKADAQLSCARHLSPTCEAMRHAEGRERVALTVTEAPS